ncbi:MFS transporter [Pseudarthrobacter sulfonivorans]
MALTNLFLAMVFYILMTALVLYAMDRFQTSDVMSGLAVGAFVLGAVVARLATGQAMDLMGRRRILVVSLAAAAITSTLYLVANSLGLLIAVRFVHGFTFGAASTVLAAAVISLIPPYRRSEGTGWFGTSTTAGSAFGPLIAFQLTDAFGFNAVFLACTAFSIFGLMAGLLVKLPEPPRHEDERRDYPADTRSNPRFSLQGMLSRKVLPVSLVILLAGMAYSGVLAFLNGYAQQERISPSVASSFFLVYAAVLVLTRFIVGPIHDRFGDNAAVIPLIVSFMSGLAVLSLWPTTPGILISAALIALGFGALLTSLQAIAVTVVPPRQIGVATSTYFLMLDIGVGTGPIILGALIPLTGYSGMYLLMSGMMAAAIVIYWLVHGHGSMAGLPRQGRRCSAAQP